jgi:hypothetical protein
VVVEDDPPDIVTFGGPEAISRNEAVAIAEQATGKTIKVQRMPRAAARLGMRLLNRPNPAMATIFGTGLMQDLLEVTGMTHHSANEVSPGARPATGSRSRRGPRVDAVSMRSPAG